MVGTRNNGVSRPALDIQSQPPLMRQIGKCNLLKEWTEESVINWLAQWTEFARLNPTARAAGKIEGVVLKSIYVNGCQEGEEAEFLRKYLKGRDEKRQKSFLRDLRGRLKWPTDEKKDHYEKIDELFTNVFKILRGIDTVATNKELRKTVMKLIVQKLPAEYIYDEELLEEDIYRGEVDTLLELKEKIREKSEHAELMERKKNIKAKSMQITEAVDMARHIARERNQLYGKSASETPQRAENSKPNYSYKNDNDQPGYFNGRCYFCRQYGHRKSECKHYQTALKKMGGSGRIKKGKKRYTLDPTSPFHRFANAPASRTIRANRAKIQLHSVKFTVQHQGKEQIVRGLLDTGADESIGSLTLHGGLGEEIPMSGEDVRAQITLGDNKTRYAVAKVIRLNVKMEAPSGETGSIQGMKTYLVDSPNWDTLIIGLPTLKKLGWVKNEFFNKQ